MSSLDRLEDLAGNQRVTAIHEAGHAVASVHYGRGFWGIHIRASETALLPDGSPCLDAPVMIANGMLRAHLDGVEFAKLPKRDRQRFMRYAKQDLHIAVSGAVAEYMSSRAPETFVYSEEDFEKAGQIALWLTGDRESAGQMVDEACDRATRCFETPAIQDVTNALADVLVECGSVVGDAALEWNQRIRAVTPGKGSLSRAEYIRQKKASMPRPVAVPDPARPWIVDDAEWFRQRPHRSTRLRPVHPAELMAYAARGNETTIDEPHLEPMSLVHEMRPGARELRLIFLDPDELPPDSDVYLTALFASRFRAIRSKKTA